MLPLWGKASVGLGIEVHFGRTFYLSWRHLLLLDGLFIRANRRLGTLFICSSDRLRIILQIGILEVSLAPAIWQLFIRLVSFIKF